MRTNSYISAAALAAALLAFPHATLAQDNGLLNLDLGGVGLDADIDLGGDSLLDVDAGLSLGDHAGVGASVDIGGTDDDDSLVDIDLDAGSASTTGAGNGGTGPNGGRLIDLGNARVDADIDLLDGANDGRLVDGAIRIGALDNDLRARALLDLVDDPHLADIDLDAAIDDRRVSILAAADLLSADELARIDAAIAAGGNGRDELRAALDASVELGAILGRHGIDPADVLAVEVAENGAAEIIVLGDTARLALAGDNGDLADLSLDQLADADVDLLSDAEAADVQLGLLAPSAPTAARLRLLPTAEDGSDIDIADLSVAELGQLDVTLLASADDEGSGTGADDGDGTADNDGTGTGNDTGGPDAGNGSAGDDTDTATADDLDVVVTGAVPPAVQVGAGFGIAALGCNVGVLALANGVDASPEAIADADSLELVRIDGCARSLVDADIGVIHRALSANPAISDVLDDADIPLDEVIGATIQGGTLTLFIEPAAA